jgi:hypothetical protein
MAGIDPVAFALLDREHQTALRQVRRARVAVEERRTSLEAANAMLHAAIYDAYEAGVSTDALVQEVGLAERTLSRIRAEVKARRTPSGRA